MPLQALLSVQSVPADFRRKHEDISVHGLLASYLAFAPQAQDSQGAWIATWPSRESMRASMPFYWPEESKDQLPASVRAGMLDHQESKFEKDFAKVEACVPGADMAEYLYFWLVVNTRSFYFEFHGQKRPISRDDCMVLCPFIDYFNHEDHGVSSCCRPKASY